MKCLAAIFLFLPYLPQYSAVFLAIIKKQNVKHQPDPVNISYDRIRVVIQCALWAIFKSTCILPWEATQPAFQCICLGLKIMWKKMILINMCTDLCIRK